MYFGKHSSAALQITIKLLRGNISVQGGKADSYSGCSIVALETSYEMPDLTHVSIELFFGKDWYR